MKILTLLNFTTNSIKHVNAAEYVIPEQTALGEGVDETAAKNIGPLRHQWEKEDETNPRYTKAYIQPAIYSDNTVGESSTINRTSCVLDQPPFNIIYNIHTEYCWLIAIIHNIRANTELKKYIFENCTNDNVKNGINRLLNINGRDISKEEYNLAVGSYFDINKCGFEDVFLGYIFADIEKSTISLNIPKYPVGDIFTVYKTDLKNIYSITLNIYRKNQPIFTIYKPANEKINGCLSISNAILQRPNSSKKSDISIDDSLFFNYTPNFLIVLIEDEEAEDSYCKNHDIGGIVLEKSIRINVGGKEERQEYSLTGISVRSWEPTNNWHTNAIIKYGNQWHDTDYSTCQEINHKSDEYEYKHLKKLFVDELNMFSEVVVDYVAREDFIFVNILFYQLM